MKKLYILFFSVMFALSGMAGIRGDMDESGIVDVEDVNAAINVILKLNTINDYPGNGDMDGNGYIDVEDVNAMINIILKLPGGDTTVEVNPANVFTNGLPKSVNGMTVSTNAKGQVTSIENDEVIVTFEYISDQSAPSLHVTPSADADVIMKIYWERWDEYLMYFITLGDNGFATHAVEYSSYDNEEYEQGDILDFDYDRDGHLIKMVQDYDCDDVTNIEWGDDGDIIKVMFVDGESITENWTNTIYYTNSNFNTVIDNKGCVMLYDEIFGVDVDYMGYAYYAGMLGKATKHLPVSVEFLDEGYGYTKTQTYEWIFNGDGFPISVEIEKADPVTFSW